MLLVCNAPEAVGELLQRWQPQPDAVRARRVERLLPSQPALAPADLERHAAYRAGCAAAARLA